MIRQIDLEFRSLAARDQGLLFGTLLAAALFLVHFVFYSPWYVEDAAITFAFADHAAHGWGFVAYPGGERVEGFSNPTWTLLLAGIAALGLPLFGMAKLLGAVCGLIALFLSTVWARELIDEERRHYALVAPFFLATTPSFAMWSASGLENPLLAMLVTGAALRGLLEVRQGGGPLSALLWSLVALSRPEAPLYAAIGGGVCGLAILRTRGPSDAARYAAQWLGLFLLPFGAWHGWRYRYFAWELPNTYYAKLASGESDFQPLGWDVRGWRYLRDWALQSGQGFLGPLYLMGQVGVRDNRALLGASLGVVAFLLTLPGVAWFRALPLTPTTEPEWLVATRVGLYAIILVGAPLLGVGRRSDDARALAWFLVAAALFFGLYSGGDWMKGHRWPSLMVVPMAVLLADAVASLVEVFEAVASKWMTRVGVALTFGLSVVLGIVQTITLLSALETSPYDVSIRVRHMEHVAARLGLERVSAGEIDMGAHVWWSEFELVDLAGLLDVPTAHHAWEAAFVTEYILRERRPDFMHVHSYWGRKTNLQSHARFRNEWVEIPPYPTGPYHLHAGNHVRRDLLFTAGWRGTSLGLWFGRALELVEVSVLSELTAPGDAATIALSTREPRPHADTRLTLFLFGEQGLVSSADAPVLWDWVEPRDFQASDVAHTRLQIPIPSDTPHGSYTLGLVAWTDGPKATPLSSDRPPVEQPVFSVHEVHLGEVVVASREAVDTRAEAKLVAARGAAEADSCRLADEEAAAVRVLQSSQRETWEPRVRRLDAVRARCWAREALASGEAPTFHRALRLAPGDEEVLSAGRTLADRFEAGASEALEAGDIEGAYAGLRDALVADPTRSWSRRRAESLRDERLGL